MSYGYDFYIDGLILPITPGELNIKVGSTNEVITLINEGEINILKSPSLIEVSFEARFPMRDYPYSRSPQSFQSYFEHFKALKEGKKPFRFIVARRELKGKRTWDTNLEMALEEFEIKESADEGDDVIVSFELRQYKNYGVKTLRTNVSSTSSSSTPRSTTNSPSQETSKYTVETGDTLWEIAKAAYGDGSKWTVIYEANKDKIDNPNLIYTGQEFIVPNVDATNLSVQKLSGTKSVSSGAIISNMEQGNYSLNVQQNSKAPSMSYGASGNNNSNGYVSASDIVKEYNNSNTTKNTNDNRPLVDAVAYIMNIPDAIEDGVRSSGSNVTQYMKYASFSGS